MYKLVRTSSYVPARTSMYKLVRTSSYVRVGMYELVHDVRARTSHLVHHVRDKTYKFVCPSSYVRACTQMYEFVRTSSYISVRFYFCPFVKEGFPGQTWVRSRFGFGFTKLKLLRLQRQVASFYSRCHTKRRQPKPSFDRTMAKIVSPVVACCSSHTCQLYIH